MAVWNENLKKTCDIQASVNNFKPQVPLPVKHKYAFSMKATRYCNIAWCKEHRLPGRGFDCNYEIQRVERSSTSIFLRR